VDAWAFEQPCPRAVRNRRLLVQDLLKDLPAPSAAAPLSVVSLGSGPAAEVFDLRALDSDPESRTAAALGDSLIFALTSALRCPLALAPARLRAPRHTAGGIRD
jgi:hypothetical protein